MKSIEKAWELRYLETDKAIEIAKEYSTEKSGQFINGVIDALFLKLKSMGKISKQGRGLMDSTLKK